MVIGLVCAGAADAHVEYAISDLGTLGGDFSDTGGISSSGLVTGWSSVVTGGFAHLFVYDGVMHDLGTAFGASAQGYAVNDHGHVAGIFVHGSAHALFYDGAMHDLVNNDFVQSFANGINNSDEVVGEAPNAFGSGEAFIYNGAMHFLGTLPDGTHSVGNSINDNGQVTGYSDTAGNHHAIMWNPTSVHGVSGTMIDLGTLGGSQSYGLGISSNGLVCGMSDTVANDPITAQPISHAFLFDGAIHELGTLGGISSQGNGVNSRGQVVGQSYLGYYDRQHAFVYNAASGMVDLNSLIDPSLGWELFDATAINDAGTITGYGNVNGQEHAFLLVPVPEPASALLAWAGILGLLRPSSRRQRGTPGEAGGLTGL
jgi:probable HAF family extracellular repeat protein